jgi:hypothetical protein
MILFALACDGHGGCWLLGWAGYGKGYRAGVPL